MKKKKNGRCPDFTTTRDDMSRYDRKDRCCVMICRRLETSSRWFLCPWHYPPEMRISI